MPDDLVTLETHVDKAAAWDEIAKKNAEIKRLRAALAEARQWLISVDKELLSHGSTTLKPTIAKIDAALGRDNEQQTREGQN